MDDEGLETSTASDDSTQGPWTVVTSPTHARRPSQEASSPQSPAAVAQLRSQAAPPPADLVGHQPRSERYLLESSCSSTDSCLLLGLGRTFCGDEARVLRGRLLPWGVSSAGSAVALGQGLERGLLLGWGMSLSGLWVASLGVSLESPSSGIPLSGWCCCKAPGIGCGIGKAGQQRGYQDGASLSLGDDMLQFKFIGMTPYMSATRL